MRLSVILLSLVGGTSPLLAQAPGQAPPPPMPEQPTFYWDLDYTFGYRFLDVDGNRDRFDTDFNLDSGFRLTELRLSGDVLPSSKLLDRFRIESYNLADPYERIHTEFEKDDLYRASGTLYRRRNTYKATGEFHRVDRKEQVTSFELAVPIDDLEVFAGFSRSHYEGFWLTNRIGNRNVVPLTSIDNVGSPRNLMEDAAELGINVAMHRTSISLTGEYLDQNEDNRWSYSQPAVVNSAFLDSGNLTSRTALEGPGVRANVTHVDGPLDVSIGARWLDRRRRIVGAGTATGFDAAQFNATTTSLSTGWARTALVDGTVSYDLTDSLTAHADLRYLDHEESLFIEQTDITVYPTLATTVSVDDRRNQVTVSRRREATAELDWEAIPSLTLSGGWGWSQEKLRVPDLDPADNDFSRGTVIEDGFVLGASWRPDSAWHAKVRYRDFGQGGVQLHEIVDHHTRGVTSRAGYRDDALWYTFGIDHHRSQNPVSDSRTARTAYSLSGGLHAGEDLDWHGSYTLSDIDSRTRTNFYFDPSPTPVSTQVGFRGETHSVASGLDWKISDQLRAALYGAYTTVHGDFEIDMLQWSVDISMPLPQGSAGIKVEQFDYHESGNPDDYDAIATYLYFTAKIRAPRPR